MPAKKGGTPVSAAKTTPVSLKGTWSREIERLHVKHCGGENYVETLADSIYT